MILNVQYYLWKISSHDDKIHFLFLCVLVVCSWLQFDQETSSQLWKFRIVLFVSFATSARKTRHNHQSCVFGGLVSNFTDRRRFSSSKRWSNSWKIYVSVFIWNILRSSMKFYDEHYKFRTIPIAKRRYYGRVQQAVHEFLAMGPDVVRGDMTSESIQHFFDRQATVIVEGGANMSINGQCTRKDGNCKGAEIRDSRWNDMKASMYLLGNAFRINQQKPPDNLPTVKAAKAFFKEM